MSDGPELAPLNPLPADHRQLAREARRQRRAFQRSPLGSMARQLEDAMTEYHQMRQTGVSRDDAVKGLEAVLRDCWPSGRTYTCAECDGSGWRQTCCTHALRCGRWRCSRAESAYEHAYVVPCDCPSGDRNRPRVQQPEDDVVAVGRTAKPRKGGFRRMGG